MSPMILLTLTLAPLLCSGGRSVRYVEWSPPVVHPQRDHVTVQARQNYTLSCEGHKPVSWQLPEHTRHSDIMSRYETLGNQEGSYYHIALPALFAINVTSGCWNQFMIVIVCNL